MTGPKLLGPADEPQGSGAVVAVSAAEAAADFETKKETTHA